MQDRSIEWMNSKIGRSFYSMTQRNGQVVNGKEGYDCSSAEYYAAIHAGIFPQGHRIGNTDTLFGDLERQGWVQLPANKQGNYDTKRGDKFIWGKRGASGGAAGHTGEFINENDVIHCAAFSNGVTINNYDQLAGWNGWPEVTFYRYKGPSAIQTPPSIGDPNDQNVDIGSWIKLDGIYTVDDVHFIGNIWQVQSNQIAPKGFNWDDNGIPAEPVYEVDNEGYATLDQNLDKGSKFKIPGKYQVQDLKNSDGIWWALIEWNGLKFWVDLNPATEISGSDSGTPTPGQKPAPSPAPEEPKPTVPEKETPSPEPEPEDQPPVEVPVVTLPNEDKPQGEVKMSFTKEQQAEIQANVQSILDSGNFTPVISDRVKTIAYFATDLGAAFVGFLAIVLGLTGAIDSNLALGISAATIAFLTQAKQIFRISAKK